MTSTLNMQGMGEGTRNSSRVLAAPGGASSDIFGTATQAKSLPTPTKTVVPPYGTSSGSTASDASSTSAPVAPPPAASATSNVTKATASNVTNGAASSPARNRGQAAGNPITGESYAETKQIPSTKVCRPPGGQSSIQF